MSTALKASSLLLCTTSYLPTYAVMQPFVCKMLTYTAFTMCKLLRRHRGRDCSVALLKQPSLLLGCYNDCDYM